MREAVCRTGRGSNRDSTKVKQARNLALLRTYQMNRVYQENGNVKSSRESANISHCNDFNHSFLPSPHLVMALSISNALLSVSSVCQSVEYISHVPVFIAKFFQNLKQNKKIAAQEWAMLDLCKTHFNPFVGDCHRQPVVEPDTTFTHRSAHAWHSWYILNKNDENFWQTVPHTCY